jgi:predicted HTH domain antitoxin
LRKLSLGKARELGRLGILEFQHLLASRRIPVHYDLAEYEEDMATLARLDAE